MTRGPEHSGCGSEPTVVQRMGPRWASPQEGSPGASPGRHCPSAAASPPSSPCGDAAAHSALKRGRPWDGPREGHAEEPGRASSQSAQNTPLPSRDGHRGAPWPCQAHGSHTAVAPRHSSATSSHVQDALWASFRYCVGERRLCAPHVLSTPSGLVLNPPQNLQGHLTHAIRVRSPHAP